VDWEHTQAYAIGLAGIYLNLKGREKFGTVSPGRSAQILKDELIAKLSNLKDPEYNKIAINQVFDSQKVYSGPYSNEAPDLIIGYNDGYRISWEGATGVTTREIFSHNTKKWSGDHGIDPSLVDGILYCNHKINNNHAGIIDLAPTILDQFGIKPPQYMEGKPLKINRNESDNHDSSKN
jgi:predicted AlkP superfamily phosphohydrolase/phosphomutase